MGFERQTRQEMKIFLEHQMRGWITKRRGNLGAISELKCGH
jgi:hypothetical protein